MSSHLAAAAGELDRCNKCGFCQTVCPTYRVTGFEWLVTRGRISLVQDVLAGAIDVTDPDLGEAVDSCLVCGACMGACPPQIQIHDIIYAARRERLRRRGLNWLERLVYRRLLPHPGLLRLAVKAGHLAERLGLRAWAERSGALGRWPALARASRIGPPLPGRTARELIAAAGRELREAAAGRAGRGTGGRPRARVAYFLPCTREFLYPAAARATVRVLAANGVEVVIPPAVCCGLPCQSGGDLAGARALARRNLAYLQGLDVDAIVVDEGSCAAHLQDYPELLAGTPGEPAARRLQAKLTDLATFLDGLGLVPPGPVPARVTWHDPCSLRHYLQVAAAPRRLLQAVPGVEFVEAADAGLCCGGAGAFMLTQPDLSDRILDLKLDGLQATGAGYIVTAAPACFMQLQRGARARGLGARVLSLSEFLELAYGAGQQGPPPAVENGLR